MLMPADQLLLTYYQQSHREILGIDFPRSFALAQRFRSLNEYLRHEYSDDTAPVVQALLRQYRTETAPLIKIKPLLNYLSSRADLVPSDLLDFGCGKGYMLGKLVMNLRSIRNALGIDPDLTELPRDIMSLQRGPLQISWRPSLRDMDTTDLHPDLIVVAHTLHHMEEAEQDRAIEDLVAVLRSHGILYLYEDSWSSSDPLAWYGMTNLDVNFYELSITQRLEVFRLNDYWSNAWCYERSLSPSRLNYRTLEEWHTLLASKGLLVVSSGVIGFDLRRLHGVPSVWLIASALPS